MMSLFLDQGGNTPSDKTENLWLNLTNGMIPYRRLSGNELPSV